MEQIRRLERRIGYCREFRQRVHQFVQACDAYQIDYDYYQFYINRFLMGKSPDVFLEEIDQHIDLCERHRKHLVQEHNKKKLYHSYLLIATLGLFLMFITTSAVSTTLTTGYAVLPLRQDISISPPDLDFTLPSSDYPLIEMEQDDQMDLLIQRLNSTITDINKMDGQTKEKVLLATSMVLDSLDQP